jgi:NhaA family Na+:H+ antiporter
MHRDLAERPPRIVPVAAACVDTLVPALINLLLNGGRAATRGLGNPHSHGYRVRLRIFALHGKRVPAVLELFLSALAIVDDVGPFG